MISIPLTYLRFAFNNPWRALALCLLLTMGFVTQILNLKVDSTPYFIDTTHPERREEEVVRKQFTNAKEQAFVMVVAAGGADVFNPGTFQVVRELTSAFDKLTLANEDDAARLAQLATTAQAKTLAGQIVAGGINRRDGELLAQLKAALAATSAPAGTLAYLDDLMLRAAPVHKVRSLTNVENIEQVDGMLDVSPLVKTIPATPAAFSELRKRAAANPLYRNIVLSNDLKATSIQVEFNIPDHDSKNLVRAYDAMVSIIDGVDTGDKVHLGGTPVVNAQIVQVLEHDNAIFFPGVIAVIGVVLCLYFRRAQGVLLPLAIAVMSVIWTLGTMTLLGIKQNIVTTAMPVFLITIGVCDAVHFLVVYYDNVARMAKWDALEQTVRRLTKPMVCTAVTTMFGFYAVTFTELVLVRDFGIVMVFGIFYALLLTMLLLPPLLVLSGAKKDRAVAAAAAALPHAGAHAAPANGAPSVFGRGRKALAALLIGVTGGSLYLSSQVHFDQHNTSSFNASTRLRQDDAVINRYMGGTSPLNISFHASEPGAFKNPELVRALDSIGKYMREKHQAVGYVSSPAEFLKRIHQVMAGGEQAYALPQNLSSEMVAQYYLLYESGSNAQLNNVVDADYTNARIAVLARTDQASVWRAIIDDTDRYIKTVLPAGVTYKFSNVGNIQKANLNEVIAGQYNSFIGSVVFILITMLILWRSLALSLVAVVPMLATVAILFACMTIMDINLDIGTCLIASLVFGIGDDFIIHFISEVRDNLNQHRLSMQESIAQALDHVSRPIVINALSLGLGFLVLGLSDFAPIKYLGLFIAGSMLLCAALVLIVVPVILMAGAKLKLFAGGPVKTAALV